MKLVFFLAMSLFLSVVSKPIAHTSVVPCTVLSVDSFADMATVTKHDTHDFRDINFFEVRFKNEAIAISADGNTQLAKFLRQTKGKVCITIEPYDTELHVLGRER